MKECPTCARKLEDYVDTCPTCGYVFGGRIDVPKETRKPTAAGILMLASALMAIILATMILTGYFGYETMLDQAETQMDESIDISYFKTVLNVCSIILICIALIEIVGAAFAFRRLHWHIALLGAIVGIFLIGFMFLSSILSVIALILLYLSKDEFI